MTLPKKTGDYLILLARYVTHKDLPKIVRKIGVHLKIPFQVGLEELIDRLDGEISLTRKKIRKELRRVIFVQEQNARKLCMIGDKESIIISGLKRYRMKRAIGSCQRRPLIAVLSIYPSWQLSS